MKFLDDVGYAGPRHFVSYSYAISGVTYHTAQDVTGLQSQVRFERLVAGQPASVKFDPSYPRVSIVGSDVWSGFRLGRERSACARIYD